MQQTSATWKQLLAAGAALEARATIGGVAYTDISAPVIRRAAMQGSLGIGNVVSASLSLVIRGAGVVPRSAKVTVQARLKDGQTASEWLPQGTFYISRRARDPVTGLLALECYDALLKANALWEPSAGTWPRTMAAVAAELAALLGLEIDSRTTLPEGAAFVISEPPAGTTVRDVLGVIAQAGGGNWIVTPENRLRLLPVGGGTDTVDVTGVTGGMKAGAAGTVTGVRCTVDGLQTLIGDDTGIVVDATVAPVIAADMAEGLIGQAYQPFSLTGAIYDPAAELGDVVRAGVNGEVASVLYSETAALGPAFRGDIEAPEAGEIADEYPYIGSGEKVLALAKAAVNEAVDRLDDDLTQQEIFNRLTDNGAAQGLVLYNGQLYINASYINAGMLNARFINFNAPVDDFAVPNENDPDTLLDGQTVTGGWIVNESGSREIVALECDYAKLLRGRTITLKFTFNGELSFCEYAWDSLDGPSGIGTVEPVSPANPYTYYFTVPDEADSFRLVMTCGGLKQIDATVSGSQIVYPDDIRFTYAGLQIGKFLVDRSGNLFGKGQNEFDGTARFNGNVYFRNPSSVRTNLEITPANIGAVAKTGDTMTGPLTMDSNLFGALGSTGFRNVGPNGALSYLCTENDFYGSGGGWGHFIICNHGNGETYYNYVLRLPFWDSPKYKRQMGGTSAQTPWYDFLTSEKTVTVSQGGTGATTAAGAISKLFDIYGNDTRNYPNAPGVYRTVGTNIFSNLQPGSLYGVLIIIGRVYAAHFYIDSYSNMFVGFSGDVFGEPTTWRQCTP